MRRTIAWIMALIMLMTVMPVGIVAESLEPVLVGSSVDELKSDADLESGDEPAGEVSQESEIKSGADEPTKTTGADETDETDVTTEDDETDETDVTTGDDDETDETDMTTGDDEETDETDVTTGDDEETDETDVTTGDDEETDETDVTTGDDDEADETDVTTGDDDETDETDVTTGADETDETDVTTGADETDETDVTTEDDETDETDVTTGDDDETDETDVTTGNDETDETDETTGNDETDETDETTGADETGKTDVTSGNDETGKTDETSGDEEIDESPDTTQSIADFGIMLLSLDLDIEEETPNLSIQVDDIVIGKSFSFSWSKVDYADHYQVSVVRIGAGDVETKLADQKDVGNATSYTVPASEVIEGTARFRIYVGAAPREGQCSWEEMIKSNVVTIYARKTEAESMDVTITVTDKAVVTWDPVDGTDYYLYSAINKKDNTYIYDRKNTTGTKFTISASDLEAGAKYKIWVAAYADGLADPISQFLMDETILLTECSHTLSEKTNEHKVYEHISDDEHAKYSVYDVICKTCAETIEKDHKELLDKEAHTLKEGKCDTCDYQILSITVAYQFDDEGNAIFTWNPVDSAHHYAINYRLNDVPEYDGKHNIGNVTSYQIPAARLNAGDTIKFWIVACDENGNEMTITPYTNNTVQDDETAEVPGQKNPEELSITLSYVFNTDGSVTFSWNEVDTANLYGYDYLINGEKVNASVLFTEGTSATVPASLLQIGDVIKFWVGAYYDEKNQVPILPGDDIKVMKTDYATVGAVDRVLTVTHSMDAKGNVNFSWNEVETADHFGINYRINEVPAYTGAHMLDQGVTSYQIPASEFNLGAKIKFWVAAYDAQNKEIKANPYTTDIVQRTDYCDVPAPFDVTVEWEQDSAVTGDVISAKATVSGGSGTYNYYWDVYCGDTQITHYNGGADSFQWTTDAAGDWLFIAYVKDCKTDEWVSRASSRLTVIDELHDWKTVTSTEYIIRSDELHDVVTTTYQECGDCGKKTEPVVTTETVAHEFTSKTGYRDEHPHQAYHTCRYCGAEANIKDQYKTANGKVQSSETCCICHGHVWLTDEPQEVNGEWRVYCKNCGRYKKVEAPNNVVCQHGEGYINSHDVEEPPIYTNTNDEYNHVVFRKSYTEAECVLCGETRQMSISTSSVSEAHVFGADDICEKCGYVKLHQNRYEVYISSKYYSSGASMMYIGIGQPVVVMLYDKVEKRHIRASSIGATLSLNDPENIASIQNGDEIVANNSGTFSVVVSHLNQQIGIISVGATLLSVKDKLFKYELRSSGAIRLDDLEAVDWNDANIMLTNNIAIGDFKCTTNQDGSYTVTFNAYNSSSVVIGIAVFDANGNKIGVTQIIDGYWETGSFLEGTVNTIASTIRTWDGKNQNGFNTQETQIELKVPEGGYIQILQMNEDADVYVANIAELFLGSVKIYSDVKNLTGSISLSDLVKNVGKESFYEIIKNKLISEFGTMYFDQIITDAAKDPEYVLEVLASNSKDIVNDLLAKLPESVGKTAMMAGEDAILLKAAPWAYFVKHGAQAVLDTSGKTKLVKAFKNCMNNSNSREYVSSIIAPHKYNYDPNQGTSDVLPVTKRIAVTVKDVVMRQVPNGDYQHAIAIPANTELEIAGSITGEDGILYYEVIYNGNHGYITADEAVVR